MRFYSFIKEVRAFLEFLYYRKFGEKLMTEEVLELLHPVKQEKSDKDSPNLYIGKIIDDGNVKCEVVSFEENDFRIKILEINWPRLETYMNLNTIYPLLSCYESNGMQVWEVDPDKMKRDTSQVLLSWEEEIGWTWDLDS